MRCLRRAPAVVTVAAVMVALLVPAAPSHASATLATGDMTFTGTASLPKFPCSPPPPFGDGPCAGTFTGQWAGHYAGTAGFDAFDVTWNTVGDSTDAVSASFVYAEFQCAHLETLAGFAQGTGAAVAGAGWVRGSWQVAGEPFARDITGVQATLGFDWTRSLNNAVIVFSTFTLQVNVADMGWQTVASSEQIGDATFAVPPPNLNEVPSCEKPWSAVEATVAGTVPLVQGPVQAI